MIHFLYTLIIYPIRQIIELCYYIIQWIIENQGIAIIGISVSVSVLTLPLYLIADKIQHKEREVQNKLKPKIDRIKAVFKGDESYMLLSVLYRQNGYHPIYALRNSLGFLIQIPFFIAAYSFLADLDSLKGTPFLFIQNLAEPDRLLSMGSFSFNLLPLLMTAINCISSLVYTKDFSTREKVQLYVIAFLFLILLYNSPSGMVLYWTMNNVFSLIKNILQRTPSKRKIIFSFLVIILLVFESYLIFLHNGKPITRLFIGTFFALLIIIILSLFILLKRMSNSVIRRVFPKNVYFLSLIILFLHIGIVIPGALIVSSVKEFSFIEQYNTPFPFIFNTALQTMGFTLFWPICLYFLMPNRGKYFSTIFAVLLFLSCLINTFLVPEKFGFLTTTMLFSEPSQYPGYNQMVVRNVILQILVIIFVLFCFRLNKLKIIGALQIVTIISLSLYGIVNLYSIHNNFLQYKEERASAYSSSSLIEPVYKLSKYGKNIVLIMIDNVVSGFIPYIFNENPELKDIFSGWKYYPNTVSFANHTLAGALPIYGGYEYTPKNINLNDKKPLLEKQTEAYLLLPKIFLTEGYNVTITDPPFDNYLETNLGIYRDYPEIHAENLIGKYTSLWLDKHPEITGLSIPDILKRNLLYFSFFKCSPIYLRMYIYNRGYWLAVKRFQNESGLTTDGIDFYILLDYLVDLTGIEQSEKNTFSKIYEPLPHQNFFLQYPDYKLSSVVTDYGPSPLAKEAYYHVDTVSFILLGKWISFLKEKNIYDNTRIIIVSDHARGSSTKLNYVTLPTGGTSQTFNPVLMVKDFNSNGEFETDNTFMTNGDVPLLLLKDIVNEPVNPFTGNKLAADKENGALITTIGALSSRVHTKYQYKIGSDQWLHVKDNIFDVRNWSKVNP